MSDSLPPEYIEQLKARDTRFQVLADAIAVETDLRDNITIRSIMEAVRRDADSGMREIVEISPADVTGIALCQMKLRTLTYIRDVLDVLMRRGALAEQAIRAEDVDEC